MAHKGFKRFHNKAEAWNDETVLYRPVTPAQAYDIGQVNSAVLENKKKTKSNDHTEPGYESSWRKFKQYVDDLKRDQSSSGGGELWKKNKCHYLLLMILCVLFACILCVVAVLLFYYVVLPNVGLNPSYTLSFGIGGLIFIIIWAVFALIITADVWKKWNCRELLIAGAWILFACILCACAVLVFNYGILPTRGPNLGETMSFGSGGVTFVVLFLFVGLIVADTHTDAEN